MNDRMIKYLFPIKTCMVNRMLKQFNDSMISELLIFNNQNLTQSFFNEKLNNKIDDPKRTVSFLYCPRCGLRMPNSEIFEYYGGYCPSCGCRMIEEGVLPFRPNEQRDNK